MPADVAPKILCWHCIIGGAEKPRISVPGTAAENPGDYSSRLSTASHRLALQLRLERLPWSAVSR
jgi:hypothetical protein